VSDLAGIEEIAAQTTIRVNERTKHGKIGWGLSPNIERTHLQREKKVTAPAGQPPVTVSTSKGASLGRLITDYRTLVETCRARADELELSRSEVDRLSGLPSGYAGKILGKDAGAPGKKHKKMWPISLELMLSTLGLRILLIEDEAATARTLALRTPVQSNQQRFGNVSRITPKLLAAPALEIVPDRQKRGPTKYG
jgi:hypothetical protein